MKKNKFPPGWNDARVRGVIARYESQTDLEAVAEDEAAYEASGQTMMEVPRELVPVVRELIARKKSSSRRPRRSSGAKKVRSVAHAKHPAKRLRTISELAAWDRQRER